MAQYRSLAVMAVILFNSDHESIAFIVHPVFTNHILPLATAKVFN